MTSRTYLDWNATAPLRLEAREAMAAALDVLGNPSSVHSEGRRARALVEKAREQVAALLGAEARNVVFTSGGTEANMLALTPALEYGNDKQPRDRLLVSAIEHSSVLCGGRFPAANVTLIRATRAGVVDLDHLAAELEHAERPLVSVMAVNNETGVVQPIRQVADMVHGAGGLLHVDAVQAVGRIPFDINELAVDLVSVAAHKIGGPLGVGALVRREQALHFPAPLMRGGGQERGLRAGTENLYGISAFGAAADILNQRWRAEDAHIRPLRDKIEAGLRGITPAAVIFGEQAQRAANTVLYAVPGVRAEIALIALDLEGVSASSGSACSSGKITPSHVLAAMGVERDLTAGAIRLSLGHSSTEEDVEAFLRAWRKCAETLLKGREGIAA